MTFEQRLADVHFEVNTIDCELYSWQERMQGKPNPDFLHTIEALLQHRDVTMEPMLKELKDLQEMENNRAMQKLDNRADEVNLQLGTLLHVKENPRFDKAQLERDMREAEAILQEEDLNYG